MNRRFARVAVLAVFVVALLAPWDRGPDALSYLGWLLKVVRSSEREWLEVLAIGATLSVPVACLVAVLAPSRLSVVAYRVVLTPIGCLFLPLIVLFFMFMFSFGIPDEWGVAVYGFALVLALVVELRRPRPAPGPDYSDVFR